MEQTFLDYRNFVGSTPEKFFKATLASSPRLMLGLNCLEPGQEQKVHDHADQDKFYFVVEGEGIFTVGDQQNMSRAGMLVWAPASIPHGVKNTSTLRLVILMGIAPAP